MDELRVADGVSVTALPSDPEWDAFVDGVEGGHHLQTSMWAQIKAKSDWRALRLQVRQEGQLVGGCQLLVRRLPIGAIAYCPRGPVARDRDPALISAVLDALRPLARRERILYLKVQPPAGGEATEPLLRARGFVASAYPAAQVATVRVDVQRDPDEILAGMRPQRRRNIRKGERVGITVRTAAQKRCRLSPLCSTIRAGGEVRTSLPTPSMFTARCCAYLASRARSSSWPSTTARCYPRRSPSRTVTRSWI